MNQHGHSFDEAKFCTLNGRFDTNDDNYTSVSSKGNAVVDYICLPHDTFEQCLYFKNVQVGKDQEKAQSEKDSHSKNRGGKKPN